MGRGELHEPPNPPQLARWGAPRPTALQGITAPRFRPRIGPDDTTPWYHATVQRCKSFGRCELGARSACVRGKRSASGAPVTRAEHVAALVEGLPDLAVVSVRVDWLRELLAGAPAEESATLRCDLTLEEAAAAVHRAVPTVRAWCTAGLIPGAYKLRGRAWRIPRAALLRFEHHEAAHHARRSSVDD